nr:hypothetical protein [Helicobacter pylori]
MNVWWHCKMFDLFVVGGYLALDFVDNFRIKGFSYWFRHIAVECSLLKHALELRASKNLCNQK